MLQLEKSRPPPLAQRECTGAAMQTFNQPLTGPTGPPGVPSSFGTTLLLLQVREPDPTGATRPFHDLAALLPRALTLRLLPAHLP